MIIREKCLLRLSTFGVFLHSDFEQSFNRFVLAKLFVSFCYILDLNIMFQYVISI